MNPALVITLSFLGISVLLALFAQKKIFRTLNTVFTTISLLLALFSVALYVDGLNIQQQLAGDKLFVLGDGETLYAAFYQNQQPTFIPDTSNQRVAFAAHDYSALREGRLLLIANPHTFDTITSVQLGDYTLTRDKAMSLVQSKHIITDYTLTVRELAHIPDNQDIKLPFTADELHGLVFAALISEYLKNTTFIDAVNAQNLHIVPQGMTFWLVSIVPKQWLPYLVEAS